MFGDLPARVRPWIFYLLAFSMITVVAVAPGASTGTAMLTPLVATLLMLLVVTRQGWTREGWAGLGLHRLGVRSWVLAVVVPMAVVGLGYALLWGSGLADVGANEATNGYGLAMLPVLLLTNTVFASVTVSLTEEIGWRGYLLPNLGYLGTRRSLLVSGFLHGAWHLPFIFLTDLYHADGNRWLVVPLFMVAVTCSGVFMGWLRLRTGSVWPAVLAHSANNAAMAWFAAYTMGDSVVLEYVAGESGLVAVVGYAVVAAWVLTRIGKADTTVAGDAQPLGAGATTGASVIGPVADHIPVADQ